MYNINNSFTDEKENSIIKSETRSKLKVKKEKHVSEFNLGSLTITNRPSAKSRDISESESHIKVYWLCRILSEERGSVNQSIDKSDNLFGQTFTKGSVCKIDNTTIYLPGENLQYRLDSVYNANEKMEFMFEN